MNERKITETKKDRNYFVALSKELFFTLDLS